MTFSIKVSFTFPIGFISSAIKFIVRKTSDVITFIRNKVIKPVTAVIDSTAKKIATSCAYCLDALLDFFNITSVNAKKVKTVILYAVCVPVLLAVIILNILYLFGITVASIAVVDTLALVALLLSIATAR